MATECNAERFEFARVKGRSVVAGFDGGTITSDAGALLLGTSDRAIGLIDRFAVASPTAGRQSGSSTRWQRWSASASLASH